MEDWDRLNHAIDGRIAVEVAFIDAMTQEFQRIQQELNECIARHPNDRQLAQVGEDVEQLGEQSRAIVPYTRPSSLLNLPKEYFRRARIPGSTRIGGKRTRRR